jgi:hypothetical protein
MFDWFKKKENNDFDPTDIQLDQLKVNFMLDYNFISYQIKKVYEYEWEDGSFAKEYQLESSSNHIYLYIEKDDVLYLELSEAKDISSLNKLVLHSLQNSDNPPNEIVYENKTYQFIKDSAGRLLEDKDDYSEFLEFKYLSDAGDILYIEQWDDDDFELSIAKEVRESEFSQILPG